MRYHQLCLQFLKLPVHRGYKGVPWLQHLAAKSHWMQALDWELHFPFLFVHSLVVGLGCRCVERVRGLRCPDNTGGKVGLIVRRDWMRRGRWVERGTEEAGKGTQMNGSRTLGKKHSRITRWEDVRGKRKKMSSAGWSWREVVVEGVTELRKGKDEKTGWGSKRNERKIKALREAAKWGLSGHVILGKVCFV